MVGLQTADYVHQVALLSTAIEQLRGAKAAHTATPPQGSIALALDELYLEPRPVLPHTAGLSEHSAAQQEERLAVALPLPLRRLLGFSDFPALFTLPNNFFSRPLATNPLRLAADPC